LLLLWTITITITTITNSCDGEDEAHTSQGNKICCRQDSAQGTPQESSKGGF